MGMTSKYKGDFLHKNLTDDPEIVVIVPKTAYFTLNGEPTRMVIPDSLEKDDDTVFDIISELQKK